MTRRSWSSRPPGPKFALGLRTEAIPADTQEGKPPLWYNSHAWLRQTRADEVRLVSARVSLVLPGAEP